MPRLSTFAPLLLTSLLLACEPSAGPMPGQGPQLAWWRGPVVCEVGGESLKGDLARPAQGKHLRRAILFVHGGGWSTGKRQDYEPLVQILAERGYTGLTIDYRLSPKVKHPQHLEDVQCAFRWLRSQAQALDIDPDRIAVIGGSAGAHLAALLAFGAQGPAAAVLHGGPYDLSVLPTLQPEAQGAVHALLGTATPSPSQLRDASPVQHIRALPTLILHGELDPLVPVDQARRLDVALRRVNAPHRLYVIPGAGHADFGRDPDTTARILLEFLQQALNP